MKVQAQIPAALVAIHNFILHHDPNEGIIPGGDSEHSSHAFHTSDEVVRGYRGEIDEDGHASTKEVNNQRNLIAQQMWDNYQQVLLERAGNDNEIDNFIEGDGDGESSNDEDLVMDD